MLISILIPAYNAQSWIAQSITSALQQSWNDKEIIVVDDGSKDSTFETAKQFASKTVKVVTQQNQGASAARNRALSLAQGDYIQWLDADNLLAPDKISRQAEFADKIGNPRVLLSSEWSRFFYRRSKARVQPSPLWADLPPLEWLYKKLDENLWMVPETWLVSRELTAAAGPWDETLSLDDDGEYFLRVVAASEMVRFVPDAHSFYRYGMPGSLSSVSSKRAKKMISQFQSMQRHIATLLKMENSPRTRAACVKFLQRWLFFFYPEQIEIVDQARALARNLGGSLSDPELSAKYALLLPLLGWRITKQLTYTMPTFKMSVRRNVDRMLSAISKD